MPSDIVKKQKYAFSITQLWQDEQSERDAPPSPSHSMQDSTHEKKSDARRTTRNSASLPDLEVNAPNPSQGNCKMRKGKLKSRKRHDSISLKEIDLHHPPRCLSC